MENYFHRIISLLESDIDSLLKRDILYVYPGESYKASVTLINRSPNYDRINAVVAITSSFNPLKTDISSLKLSQILINSPKFIIDFEKRIQNIMIKLDIDDLLMKAYIKVKDFTYLPTTITFIFNIRREDLFDKLPSELFDTILSYLDETTNHDKIQFICQARLNTTIC